MAPEGAASPVELEAKFIEDVTFADGCVVAPGQDFVKAWKVKNSGATAWPTGCELIMQKSDASSFDSESVALPALEPRGDHVAQVALRAPSVPGRYTAYWRVCDPRGVAFGHRLWVDVNVMEAAPVALDADGEAQTQEAPAVEKEAIPEAMVCAFEIVDAASYPEAIPCAQDASADLDSVRGIETDSTTSTATMEDTGAPDQAPSDQVASLEDPPVEVVEEPTPFAEELTELSLMGFADVERNAELLARFNGSVDQVVDQLLS